MKTIVFLLEEPSAAVMLKELIQANFFINPEKLSLRYVVYEGKQDLEKNLERAIRHWQIPETSFFVMRDQDAGDCKTIKERLRSKCLNAGRSDVIIRIACHELESFYLGDLAAVEKGLELKGIARRQQNKKYREPDNLSNPSGVLEELTKKQYQKIDGSRRITRNMNPEHNQSHSFNVLYGSLREMMRGML